MVMKEEKMRELLLLRYGEIALKGKNRRVFEKRLFKNVRRALSGFEDVNVMDRHGRGYVEYNAEDGDAIIEILKRVFGLVSISKAIKVDNDIDAFCKVSQSEIERLIQEKGTKTFKIETRRQNKGFPMQSPEISRQVGGYVLSHCEGIKVDVNHPDLILNIEIREKTYVFSERIKCQGGMPYGTAGKGMMLLSGGIDSPVAGYQIARRGVELEAVHFHSYPFTSERALEKVLDLGKILTRYTHNLKIYSVNILEIQKAINEHCPSEEMTILSRRFMMRIAEKIANETNCKCLITGENIGQVASQTMEGLTVTNASVDLPVLRPLIAYDKLDIIDVAKSIDTFDTSILPFEDCCTVFLPDRVVTKPRIEKMEASEALLDVDALIDEAIANKEIYVIVKEQLMEN